MVLIGLAAARLPVAQALLRAGAVLPFSGMFALLVWLGGDHSRALALVGRSYISASAVLLLVSTTPLPALLRALEWFHVPGLLVTIAQFLYRYLFVLSEQAQHMRLAAACRAGNGARAIRFQAAAGALSVLFARSYEHANGIHRAMLSRGFAPDAEPLPQSGGGAPSREGAPLVEIENLRYRYDDGTQALDGISFQLHPGECVALLGANGSGKTTFALHLNGLLRGEGRVTVCGLPLDRHHLAEVRRKVGIVFQDSDEQLFMPTVLEDAAYGPSNMGLDVAEARARALAALEQVGMAHAAAKAPYHLSSGEKRRVAIAGVLAMNPEILVLDEPTTYLDPPGQGDLYRLLRSLPQAKLLITHDTQFARALATRAVFFRAGRVEADGPVESVLARFDWASHFE